MGDDDVDESDDEDDDENWWSLWMELKVMKPDYSDNCHHENLQSLTLLMIWSIPGLGFWSSWSHCRRIWSRCKFGRHVCGNDAASFQNPRNTLLIAPRVSRNRAGTRDPHSTHSSAIQHCSLSLFLPFPLSLSFSLSSSLSPSTFSRGIRNGEHAAVQSLRERHATTPAPLTPPFPHPPFPRSCHAWCQAVWPPTHTTFSSFPPLTSLSPPFHLLSFSLFLHLSFSFFLFPKSVLPSFFHTSSSFSLLPFSSFLDYPLSPSLIHLFLSSAFGHSDLSSRLPPPHTPAYVYARVARSVLCASASFRPPLSPSPTLLLSLHS